MSWQNIPVQLSEIRQIEVVRGPNSALFGFNAGAGVINIITFDPAYDRVSNAVARFGNGEYRELSGVVSAPLGDGAGLRLSAGLREEQAWGRGYSDPDRLLDSGRDPRRGQVAGEVTFRVAEGVRVSFDASLSRSLGGELQLPGLFTPWDLTSWSVRGRATADTAAGIIEASIYHNALHAELGDVPTNRQGVTVAQLSDTVKLGAAHTLRPFIEFRHNEIRGVSTASGTQAAILSVPNTRTAYNVAAGGVMWNWAIRPDLEWTGAARYDHLWYRGKGYDRVPNSVYRDADLDRDWETLSWNAGLVWKATDVDTLRAAAARGVVLPSDYDLSAFAPVPLLGLTVAGNPYLKPTTVDNYEVQYRRRLEGIDGRAGITGFYQINRGINTSLGAFPTVSPSTYAVTLSPYSIGSSHAYGAELSLAGRALGAIDWEAEYRLAVVEDGQNASYAAFSRASPRHLLSARVGWGDGPFRADLFGRYATEMRGFRVTGAGIVPVQAADHVSVSARVAYKITERLTAALEGSSLLHERQRQSIGTEAERRIYLSLRADF